MRRSLCETKELEKDQQRVKKKRFWVNPSGLKVSRLGNQAHKLPVTLSRVKCGKSRVLTMRCGSWGFLSAPRLFAMPQNKQASPREVIYLFFCWAKQGPGRSD